MKWAAKPQGGAPVRAAIARNADRHTWDLAPVVGDVRSGTEPEVGEVVEDRKVSKASQECDTP